MDRFKKYFGEIKMTWVKVIVMAVLAGLITALICIVPALKNSSLSDLATYLDCWFIFAIIIIVNCQKWWEASLKCFVFFLISQPLVYLIQVPFYSGGWQIFQYYKYWFIITLLTLPGAVVAYQLKRKNALSVAILCVPNFYWAGMSATYLCWAVNKFPRHLLSAAICLFFGVLMCNVTFDDVKYKKISFYLFVLFFAGWLALALMGKGLLM